MKLYYSRFSHLFQKDGIYAYYNSLRIKPVFVKEYYHLLIQELISGADVEILRLKCKDVTAFDNLLQVLKEYKIFSVDSDYDSKVLERIRKSLPSPNIGVAYFILTEKCNLACSYCFIENKMPGNIKREKVLSPQMAKKGLDFFVRQIQRHPETFEEEKTILFYGGEPLTNFSTIKYLVGLISEYKINGKLPEKTNVSIITNATLMDKEKAEFFKETGVSVSISLDGADDFCNRSRKFVGGAPAFQSIIKGINVAKDSGCKFSLSMTLSEDAVEDFSKIEKAVDEYGVTGLGFNILMTDDEFKVAEDYNEKATDFLIHAFETFRTKGIYEDRMMRKVKSFVDSKIYLWDCAASGGNQIVIAPNGDVGVCHGYLHNRDYFCTNVDDEDFDPSNNDVYKEWNKRTPINMPQCQDCPALGICGGGCPANARNNDPDSSLWSLDERFCVHAKKVLNWLIWDLYDNILKGKQSNN